MSAPLDGNGLFERDADLISQSYLDSACIVPISGAPGLPTTEGGINQNAFFEAARQWTEPCRMIAEQQFIGYEVGVNGKSVLWFQRHSIYSEKSDLFRGITDAIVHTAPPNGFTNEWLLMMDLKAFAPSGVNNTSGGLFKVDSYADWMGPCDRCVFYAPEVDNDAQYLLHIAYGATDGSGNLMAESVSGYRYGKLFTSWLGREYINQVVCGGDPTCEDNAVKFYKSCQIFKKPYEIESAETFASGGTELVKVTLTTRLQNTVGETGGAPATIDRDVSTWTFADVDSEPYRTDENALRLYLLSAAHAGNATPTMGDNAWNSTIQTNYSNVFGSIIPFFMLVRLIPEPWADDNSTPDNLDTPMWHDAFGQMAVVLRAGCEGFVDELKTIEINGCSASGTTCLDNGLDLVDYTFANLCYDAFEGGNLITLPSVATDYIGEEETRDDSPIGFGPLQTTLGAAEVFNQFSACVNLLTKVRFMAPWKLTHNLRTYTGSLEVNSVLCGETTSCGVGLGGIIYAGNSPPATTFSSETGWSDVTAPIGATTGTSIGVGYCAAGGGYELGTIRVALDYRFEIDDPLFTYAIPDELQDMIPTRVGGMFCKQLYQKHNRFTDAASTPCSGAVAFLCGFEEVYPYGPANGTASCVFLRSGTVDMGPTAPGGLWASKWSGPDYCSYNSEWGITLTHLAARTPYLEIPLVDAEPEP